MLRSFVAVWTLGGSVAAAAPTLSLVSTSTGTTAASIAPGTASYALDLRADTDGMDVNGLQFYVTTSPAGVIAYGDVPVTALDSPFTADDLSGPTAGATVREAGGRVSLFKASPGDYAAFPDQAIATLSLDTADLAAGTYMFTPVAEEFVNSTTASLPGGSFDPPGVFTLTVTPEPAALVLPVIAGGLAASRRRRSSM